MVDLEEEKGFNLKWNWNELNFCGWGGVCIFFISSS